MSYITHTEAALDYIVKELEDETFAHNLTNEAAIQAMYEEKERYTTDEQVRTLLTTMLKPAILEKMDSSGLEDVKEGYAQIARFYSGNLQDNDTRRVQLAIDNRKDKLSESLNKAMANESKKKKESTAQAIDSGNERKKEKTFSEQVDDCLKGKVNRYNDLKVCDTPAIFLVLGCKQLPMMYTTRHFFDAIHPKSETNPHFHGLTIEQIKDIPFQLSNPAIIFDSISPHENGEKTIVAVLNKCDNDNAPIIVSIIPNGTGKYELKKVESNFITSIYGKDNGFDNFITYAVDAGKVLYWDKQKSQELFSVLGLQLPKGLNNLNSNTIIHQSKVFVKDFEKKIFDLTNKNSDGVIQRSSTGENISSDNSITQTEDDISTSAQKKIAKNDIQEDTVIMPPNDTITEKDVENVHCIFHISEHFNNVQKPLKERETDYAVDGTSLYIKVNGNLDNAGDKLPTHKTKGKFEKGDD